jgi:hypothetical protein
MKPFGPKRTRLEIAHHEAGHAVAGFHLGDLITEVWIDDEEGATKRPNTEVFDDLSQAQLRERVETELIICWAGPEAERRFNPKCCKMAASDRVRFDWVCSTVVGLSPKDKREWKRDTRRAAREIVTREWVAIEKVATSLFERGRLTGEEVAQLIEATRPDKQGDSDE